MLTIALALAAVAGQAATVPPTQRATPAQEAQGRKTYAAGRCYVYLSDDAKVETVKFIDGQQDQWFKGYLNAIYYGAIQVSRREPLTLAKCEAMLTS